MAAKVLKVQIEVIGDNDPDPSFLEQEGFEDRLAAYKRDEFGFVGVRARAEVEVAGTVQEIATPGLWGIESDSGDDYFLEVGKDEVDVLVDILAEMGVKKIPDGKVKLVYR